MRAPKKTLILACQSILMPHEISLKYVGEIAQNLKLFLQALVRGLEVTCLE